MRARPAGSVIGLYVDLVARVSAGDVIETRKGRRYHVIVVREQARGKHAGRQHLRAIVMAEDDPHPSGARTHRIRWYARNRRSGSGNVLPAGRAPEYSDDGSP